MARQLIIELLGEAANLTRSLRDAEQNVGTFGERVGAAGKKMTAFVSVPIIGFLGAATKMAVDDAAAQKHLADTLDTATAASAKQIAKVEEQISAFMKVSTFTDDELRPAFETLARSTGNVEDSTKLLSIAMDVAAGKGIPLETATLAVTKANEGQFAAVNKLVPGLLDLSDKTLTAEVATKKLADLFDGQANAATETAAGKAQNLKRDLGELTESMGSKLLPVAEKVVGALGGLVDGFSSAPEPLQNFALGAIVLAGALGPAITLVTNMKKAVLALNAAVNSGILAKVAAGAGAALGGIALGNKAAEKLGRGERTHQDMIPILDKAYNAVNDAIDGLFDAIPGFANGGTVGGPVGAPVLAMVHGGETITPPGRGGGTSVTVIVQGSVVTERQLVDAVHSGLLRKQSRGGPLGFEAI